MIEIARPSVKEFKVIPVGWTQWGPVCKLSQRVAESVQMQYYTPASHVAVFTNVTITYFTTNRTSS